jgi:hypothetical protein
MQCRSVRFQRLAGRCGCSAAMPVANLEILDGRTPCCQRCLSRGLAVPGLPGDVRIDRCAAAGLREVEGGPAVAGFQHGTQGAGRNVANGRGQGFVDVLQALCCEPGAVRDVIGDAFLDGGRPRPLGFDLEETGAGVRVSPGADLVAAATAAGRQHVAVQLRGVEVHGVVGEGPEAAHFEDAGLASEGCQRLAGSRGGDHVLPVHPGLQGSFGVELLEADRRQCGQLRQHCVLGSGC